MGMCVCVCVPEKSVGGGAPVGDVVEENLQLVVIVKVCGDDGAHRRRHGELLRGNVLATMTHHGQSVTHTHTHTHRLVCPIFERTGAARLFKCPPIA